MHDVRIIPEWKSSLIEKGVCGGVPQNKLTFLCLSHFTRKFWEHNIHIVVRGWGFSILRDYYRLDDDGEMILKHLCNGDEKWSLLFQSTSSAVGSSSHSQRKNEFSWGSQLSSVTILSFCNFRSNCNANIFDVIHSTCCGLLDISAMFQQSSFKNT